MKFIIDLPPSLNSIYRTGKGNYYKSKEAKSWEQTAGWQIKSQWKGKVIEKECKVQITLFLKRDADIDNRLKLLLDLLEKQNVIKNDMLIWRLEICKVLIKKDSKILPKAMIEIDKL